MDKDDLSRSSHPNVSPSIDSRVAAIMAEFPRSIQLNHEASSLRHAGKFLEAEYKYKESVR